MDKHEQGCVAEGSPLDGWADADGCDCIYGVVRALYYRFDTIGNLPPEDRFSESWSAVRPLWEKANLPPL